MWCSVCCCLIETLSLVLQFVQRDIAKDILCEDLSTDLNNDQQTYHGQYLKVSSGHGGSFQPHPEISEDSSRKTVEIKSRNNRRRNMLFPSPTYIFPKHLLKA
jgi:hypothetical protein